MLAAPFLGVLMLDTCFPRPVGDIGNPETFDRLGIPVRYSTVAGASPQRVVRESDASLIAPFVAAAQALVAQGAVLLSTSCGFLARYQRELQLAVHVPIISSSLLWLVSPLWNDERKRPYLGVLTIDAAALDARQFHGVGADPFTPVMGVAAGCEFQRQIMANAATLDVAQAERDVVAAALSLLALHPEITTLVLECTNMPPYAQAIRAATGIRVEHIVSLIDLHWKTLP